MSNHIPDSVLSPEITSTEPVNTTEITSTPEVSAQPIKQVAQPTAAEKLTSTRFAHLSKKEAALVKEREGLKREMEAFKAQKSEIDKYKKSWEMVNEIAELQKTDAVSAMRKAGFTDADLMNFLASSQDNSTPEEKAAKIAKTEIDKFRSEQSKIQEESNKKAQEAKKIEEDRTIARFKGDINTHVKATAEKLEYCSFYGEAAQDLIYETISSILADSNEMISIEEAAGLVEDFYEEQDKAMESLKKRSARKPAPKAAASIPAPSVPKNNTTRTESKQFIDNRPPTKTLSDKVMPTAANITNRELTPAEHKQMIINKYANSMKR